MFFKYTIPEVIYILNSIYWKIKIKMYLAKHLTWVSLVVTYLCVKNCTNCSKPNGQMLSVGSRLTRRNGWILKKPDLNYLKDTTKAQLIKLLPRSQPLKSQSYDIYLGWIHSSQFPNNTHLSARFPKKDDH